MKWTCSADAARRIGIDADDIARLRGLPSLWEGGEGSNTGQTTASALAITEEVQSVDFQTAFNEALEIGKCQERSYLNAEKKLLSARAQFWQCRLDVPLRQILIREPRQRWGSCSPHGVLRFNWRIVQAPMRLVDYVVVHELAHLLHPNHTPAYWALVGRLLPNYEQRKEALRCLGSRLLW